jgi:antitoxin component YwqK of YwqJK toxin-antitoxin module
MKYLLCLFCAFSFITSFAQKVYKTTYLKLSNQIVDSLSQAEFTRTIYYPVDGDKLAKVVEVYKSGKLKKEGNINADYLDFLDYEGIVSYYFNNGIKSMETTFKYGQFEGPTKIYYSTNKIYLEGVNIRKYGKVKFKVLKAFNEKGENVLDDKGNGYLDTKEGGRIAVKGNYKNGYKDGTWEIKDFFSKDKFEDIYKNEEFVSGTCTDINGNLRTYKEIQTFPYYDGFPGIKTEGDGVMRPHPVLIKSNDLDGSVAYTFDIDRFGYANNFKLITSLSKYSDKKALEFIMKKKWHPASFRGITQNTFSYLFIIGYHLD